VLLSRRAVALGERAGRYVPAMRREDLADWIERYQRAWRTAGTQLLDDLFSPEATYRPAPFDDPINGRAAIATFWESERDGPDESFTLSWEPVALDGDVGVARVEVRYAGPPIRSYRDLWIVRLDAAGRCVAFEEWPFFPTQHRTAE
jgi:SnoaL-like domain